MRMGSRERGRWECPGGGGWTRLKNWVPQHLPARLLGLCALLHLVSACLRLISALQEASFLELAKPQHAREQVWGSWRGRERGLATTGLNVLHGDLLEGDMLRKAASVCVGTQLENATWLYECHTWDSVFLEGRDRDSHYCSLMNIPDLWQGKNKCLGSSCEGQETLASPHAKFLGLHSMLYFPISNPTPCVSFLQMH